jgi:hypothetical protein
MLRLARECGITSAESRVVTVSAGEVLLVKRFDRQRVKGGYPAFTVAARSRIPVTNTWRWPIETAILAVGAFTSFRKRQEPWFRK